MLAHRLQQQSQYYYVKYLLDIIAQALAKSSRIDHILQKEMLGFPIGLTIALKVFATDLIVCFQVKENGRLEHISQVPEKIDLVIQFKHIHHAFGVFSFKESTAQAFAYQRMTVSGELSYAVRLVRCLDRLESIILPKVLAKRAVKQYPQLDFFEKMVNASKIYCAVIQSYIFRKNN